LLAFRFGMNTIPTINIIQILNFIPEES